MSLMTPSAHRHLESHSFLQELEEKDKQDETEQSVMQTSNLNQTERQTPKLVLGVAET